MIEEELAAIRGRGHEPVKEGRPRGYGIGLAVVKQARAAAFADELPRGEILGGVPGSRGGAAVHPINDAISLYGRKKFRRYIQRGWKILREWKKILCSARWDERGEKSAEDDDATRFHWR